MILSVTELHVFFVKVSLLSFRRVRINQTPSQNRLVLPKDKEITKGFSKVVYLLHYNFHPFGPDI